MTRNLITIFFGKKKSTIAHLNQKHRSTTSESNMASQNTVFFGKTDFFGCLVATCSTHSFPRLFSETSDNTAHITCRSSDLWSRNEFHASCTERPGPPRPRHPETLGVARQVCFLSSSRFSGKNLVCCSPYYKLRWQRRRLVVCNVQICVAVI